MVSARALALLKVLPRWKHMRTTIRELASRWECEKLQAAAVSRMRSAAAVVAALVVAVAAGSAEVAPKGACWHCWTCPLKRLESSNECG